MTDDSIKLKGRVMGKIFRFWFLRSMAPLLAIELIMIVIAIYFFANLIFVGEVVDNALNAALGNPFKFAVYIWNAFLTTRVPVKIVILALIFIGIKLLRDLNRGIITYVLTKRSG